MCSCFLFLPVSTCFYPFLFAFYCRAALPILPPPFRHRNIPNSPVLMQGDSGCLLQRCVRRCRLNLYFGHVAAWHGVVPWCVERSLSLHVIMNMNVIKKNWRIGRGALLLYRHEVTLCGFKRPGEQNDKEVANFLYNLHLEFGVCGLELRTVSQLWHTWNTVFTYYMCKNMKRG